MVFMNSEAIKKLLKNVHTWAPFIALYNHLDSVEWKILDTE